MGSNHMNDMFRNSKQSTSTNETKDEETDMEKLNKFLISIANMERVGIRRKILAIKKYLENI